MPRKIDEPAPFAGMMGPLRSVSGLAHLTEQNGVVVLAAPRIEVKNSPWQFNLWCVAGMSEPTPFR